MKNIFLKSLSLLLAITFLSTQTFKAYSLPVYPVAPEIDESVFFPDNNQLNSELAVLNELEAWLETHEEATFTDLAESGSPLVLAIENSASPWGSDGQEEDGSPLGIPSFFWGCFLGIVGILLVYIFSDENKEEAKKAVWGCATATAFYVVIYICFVVLIVAAEGDPYYY